jgi:hypothetical protein
LDAKKKVDEAPTVDKMIKSDAQKIIDYNYPEVHTVLDGGNRMTVKDLGQPPNLDVRKNANPHANTKWSLGRW